MVLSRVLCRAGNILFPSCGYFNQVHNRPRLCPTASACLLLAVPSTRCCLHVPFWACAFACACGHGVAEVWEFTRVDVGEAQARKYVFCSCWRLTRVPGLRSKARAA